MPAERLQKVLAAAGVASRRAQRGADRRGPRHASTASGRRSASRSTRRAARSRSTAGRSAAAARTTYLLLHKPAGVTSTTRDRHADDDRPRPRPDRARPGRRAPVPGRPARPGLRGPAPAHQRRRLGRARAPPALRRRARVRASALARAARRATRRRRSSAGIPLDEGVATLHHLRPDDRRPRSAGSTELLEPGPPPGPHLVPGDAPPGLEAPAAADVRRGRRADRAPRPGPDRARPARRPPERPGPPAQGAGGPGPRRRRGPFARSRSPARRPAAVTSGAILAA